MEWNGKFLVTLLRALTSHSGEICTMSAKQCLYDAKGQSIQA
jgi:hypothetical protein